MLRLVDLTYDLNPTISFLDPLDVILLEPFNDCEIPNEDKERIAKCN